MATRRYPLVSTFSLTSSVVRFLSACAILTLAAASLAQQPPDTTAQPNTQPDPQTAPPETAVTVPAGAHLALVLTHPVDSKSTHRGDEIFAQSSAPLTVDNQVVIPAGTFVQGKVDKLKRQGSRGELLMQSVSVIYPNGYIANIGGPLNIETDEGTAWNNPGTGAKVGVITAPLVGLGLGAAIGSAAHTTQTTNFGGTTMTSGTAKGFAIGSIVGLAAGSVVSFVLLARSHHFYMQAGSPLEMTLTEPLTLALGPVTDTGQKAGAQPAPCPFPPGALLRHPCLLPRLRGLATFPATRAHPTRTFPAHRLWGIPPEPLAPSPRNTANSADPLPVPLVK